MAKYPNWEYDLLRALGASGSDALTNAGMDAQFPNSLLALNLWAQSEGSVTNNPLATSGRGAGATTCVAQCGSSSPIYEYDNEADGVAQMARFMQGSFYTKIVAALTTNASLSDIFTAINSSPWCKGCQAAQGGYPEDLAAVVNGGSPAVSATVGTGSSSGGGGGGSGGGASANPKAGDLSTCVVSFPGFLFFSGPCILTKGGVKWLSGVAALAAGVVIGGFGVVMLAAYGFDASGAKSAVAKTAKALPGPAGRIVKASGAGSSRSRASGPAPTVGLGPSAKPPAPPDRDDRNLEAVEKVQGPIGPRGGVANRPRRQVSVPGATRRAPRRQPTERRRAIDTTPNTVDRDGRPF